VYIAEAHPADEWQMKSNREENLVFNQPKSFPERKELASVLVDRLHYRVPLAIDAIDNRADKAFAAWPERIYVLGPGGKVLYKGGMGPFGFDTEEAEKALLGLAPAATSAAGGAPKPGD
jgi:hypothetical protein